MARVTPRPGDAGDMSNSPLRADEDEYRTAVDTERDPPESPAVNPRAEPRPWMALGIVLLVIFLAILAYAVVLPLLS